MNTSVVAPTEKQLSIARSPLSSYAASSLLSGVLAGIIPGIGFSVIGGLAGGRRGALIGGLLGAGIPFGLVQLLSLGVRVQAQAAVQRYANSKIRSARRQKAAERAQRAAAIVGR